MNKILLSRQAGGVVVRYIFEEKPSEYIPFKGSFPLLPSWRLEEYYNLVHSKDYLEDCPDWMQEAVLRGEQMCTIDTAFQKFLNEKKVIDEYKKMSGSEKATLLVQFLDKNCLGIDRLKIN